MLVRCVGKLLTKLQRVVAQVKKHMSSLPPITLRHMTNLVSCLEKSIPDNSESKPLNLITTAFKVDPATFQRRKIPRVMEQYKFRKPPPRVYRNTMHLKAFKTNVNNRRNRIRSLELSTKNPQMSGATSSVTVIESKFVTLRIQKIRKRLTLGGISFSPMIGGMVIAYEGGTESLHVRVIRVVRGSEAHKSGVNTQMFLKTMALMDPKNPNKKGEPRAEKTFLSTSNLLYALTRSLILSIREYQ